MCTSSSNYFKCPHSPPPSYNGDSETFNSISYADCAGIEMPKVDRSRLVGLHPIIYYDVSSKMPSNTITMKATGQFQWGAVQPRQRLLSQLPRGNQLPWHMARGQVVSPIELVGRQHQVGRHHKGLWQGGRHHQVGQHHQGGGDQLTGQRWPEAKLWTTSSFQTCEISSPTEREDSRLWVSWSLPDYTLFIIQTSWSWTKC